MFNNNRDDSFEYEATRLQDKAAFQENHFAQQNDLISLFDLEIAKFHLKEVKQEEEFLHPVSQRTTGDLSQIIDFQIQPQEIERLGFGDELDKGFDDNLLDFSPSVCLN